MKLLFLVLFMTTMTCSGYYLYGSQLPEKTTEEYSLQVNRLPDEVWTAIGEFSAYPKWNSQFKSVQRLSAKDNDKYYIAELSGGENYVFSVQHYDRPKELKLAGADQSLAEVQSLHFKIEKQADGFTRVVIRQSSEVKLPLLRPLYRNYDLGLFSAEKFRDELELYLR